VAVAVATTVGPKSKCLLIAFETERALGGKHTMLVNWEEMTTKRKLRRTKRKRMLMRTMRTTKKRKKRKKRKRCRNTLSETDQTLGVNCLTSEKTLLRTSLIEDRRSGHT
jgi:hypothetical protein